MMGLRTPVTDCTPGTRRHTLEKQAVHVADLALAVPREAGVDRHLQQPIGIEADILTRQVPKRLNEESGADQQHHREANLASHEDAAHPADASRRGAPLTRSEARRGINLGRAPRRRQPEQECAQQRDAGGKTKDSGVSVKHQAFRDRRQGKHRHDDRNTPSRQEETQGAAYGCEQRAFDEILENQARSAGAERGAYCQLAIPGGISHHQQVADIRASGEQHERDQNHERQQRAPVLATQLRESLAGGDELCLHCHVWRETVLNERTNEPVQRPMSLSGRHVRREARNHHHGPGRAGRRDPDVRGTLDHETVEPWRGDADDRERVAVDAHRAAQHPGVAIESGSPPAVADDRHRVIRWVRRPADDRRHAEVAEEVRRDPIDLAGRLRRAVDSDRGTVEAPEADDVGHDLAVSAHRIEDRRLKNGKRFPEPARHDRNDLDLHEAVRRADRQRAQQQTVDEAEERRVGADAEGERQRHDNGERGALPEHSDRVAHVLREDVEPGQAALLAVHFAETVRPAELQEGLASRVRGGEPAPLEFVGQELEVRPQLFVELTLQPILRDERSQPRPDQSKPGCHLPDPPSARNRPITAATRCQFSVSAASCFSPGLVIV